MWGGGEGGGARGGGVGVFWDDLAYNGEDINTYHTQVYLGTSPPLSVAWTSPVVQKGSGQLASIVVSARTLYPHPPGIRTREGRGGVAKLVPHVNTTCTIFSRKLLYNLSTLCVNQSLLVMC